MGLGFNLCIARPQDSGALISEGKDIEMGMERGVQGAGVNPELTEL